MWSSIRRGWSCAVTLVWCLALAFLYTLSLTDFHLVSDRHFQTRPNSTGLAEEQLPFLQVQQLIQLQRLGNIRRVCNTSKELQALTYTRNMFYFTPTYNFSYCKVPKCGSTFWAQAFSVFNQGVGASGLIFSRIRSKVHTSSYKNGRDCKHDLESCLRSPVILVSRDPYARLLSAFIDKIYLPLLFFVNNKIQATGMNRNACHTNVTFQEFLDYVVKKAHRAKELNAHWAPIVSLCDACSAQNAAMLVKQETFSDDVKYALETFNIHEEERQILLQAIHNKRHAISVPSIVGAVFDHVAKNSQVRACLSPREIAVRMWNAFKMQGYINSTIGFPETIDEKVYASAPAFSNLVLDTINTNPMGKAEASEQRRQTLVYIYNTVKPETLKQIQDIYRLDFELYGYTKQPPLQ